MDRLGRGFYRLEPSGESLGGEIHEEIDKPSNEQNRQEQKVHHGFHCWRRRKVQRRRDLKRRVLKNDEKGERN